MTDIKRPNYFTSQFLVEKDFNDEQAYHVGMRRRLNRVQHTAGVADGLNVTRAGARRVSVGAGTAIDKDGNEIVLKEARTYELATAGSNLDVYLTIAYQEEQVDRYDRAGELDRFARTAERPLLQAGSALPAADGAAIVLARIHLNASAEIESGDSIDSSVRIGAGAKLAARSVGVLQLEDGAVTLAKLASDALPPAVQGENSITVKTDPVLKKVTVGESHSARVDNPHATTAKQIDTQGGQNRIVAQINAGSGLIANARVEPPTLKSIGTAQLADAAVTRAKLANDALPLTVQGANAITVTPDDISKTVTIGESHSAHVDNPHATTAKQIDTQGGQNCIVAQINSGTGIIANSRLDQVTVTGVVTFTNLALNQEQFSDEINPGLGDGPLRVDFSFDDLLQPDVTSTSDTAYWRAILVRVDVNRKTGRFRLYATRTQGGSSPVLVQVRWYAFKLQTGLNTTSQVKVAVSPSQITVAANTTRGLTATVTNATVKDVIWSGPEAGGGTLVNKTGSTADYTSGNTKGTFQVKATSVADPQQFATVTLIVDAAIAVNLQTPNTANLLFGQQITISGDVINTTDKGIVWSIQGNAGGSLSTTTGVSTVYTAPSARGTYVVIAASHADPSKTAKFEITVDVVTIRVQASINPIPYNGSTSVTATITPDWVSHDAKWTLSGAGTLSSTSGPSTTYTAPGVGGVFTVTGASNVDSSKSDSVTITATDRPTGGGPGGPGGGKFGPSGDGNFQSDNSSENIVADSPTPIESNGPPPQNKSSTAATTARTFVRPQKRAKPALPLDPSDD